MEQRIAYMRPGQICAVLETTPLVYIPVAPLEWHGPHLPLGVDPINAESVAAGACKETGGVVWPTLFWGTERERGGDMLEDLGFSRDDYVVGMDFPANSLPSAYCPEEVFGVLVRDTLRQVRTMGFQYAVLVNGHGAANHIATLQRLAVEFNHTTNLKVLFAFAVTDEDNEAGCIGHATNMETSALMYYAPESVDLNELPPAEQTIYYKDFAIVDGDGFNGRGPDDKHVVDDPRTKASAEDGEQYFAKVVSEVAQKVKALMA